MVVESKAESERVSLAEMENGTAEGGAAITLTVNPTARD